METLPGRFLRVCLAIVLVFSGYAFGSASERGHLMTRSAGNDSELLPDIWPDIGKLVSRQPKLRFAELSSTFMNLTPEASQPLFAAGAELLHSCICHLSPCLSCLQNESVQQRLC